MEALHAAYHWFWNENFWLTDGLTWEYAEYRRQTDKIRHSLPRHLICPILLGVCLVFVRRITERTLLYNLGIKLGVKPNRKPTLNPLLESSLQRHKRAKGKEKSSGNVAQLIATECGMEVIQVQRWLRRRSAVSCGKIVKFAESGWRGICYGSLWIYGISTLTRKSWFWDTKQCWQDLMGQHVELDVWCYYILTLSLYWSLLITQFNDAKRKDFWMMFTHHAVTIGLLSFSWCVNLTRMGSIIILLHDSADIPLEISKMLKYANRHTYIPLICGVFVLIWVVTRLVLLPFWLMKSTLFESVLELAPCPMYYILNTMLFLLLIMHLIWTGFIVKSISQVVITKKLQDARSSTEDDSENDTVHQNCTKKTE